MRFTSKSFLGQSKLLQAPLEQLFPEYLQASEQEAAATFQETAVLFQEGLVPLALVQATHDAVSSALESFHRLIYPNTYAESSATIQVQQASQQCLEPEVQIQCESGSDELEVLEGPNPDLAVGDDEMVDEEAPSHRPERFPPLEMTAEEVEELMKEGVTNENVGDQLNVMMKVLNKEIPMPKSLGGNTKTKGPKKLRRSRGRGPVVLQKAQQVKKLSLKSKKKNMVARLKERWIRRKALQTQRPSKLQERRIGRKALQTQRPR